MALAHVVPQCLLCSLLPPMSFHSAFALLCHLLALLFSVVSNRPKVSKRRVEELIKQLQLPQRNKPVNLNRHHESLMLKKNIIFNNSTARKRGRVIIRKLIPSDSEDILITKKR